MLKWLRDLLRPTIRMEARYLYNGKPATPEQRKEMDAMSAHIDDVFKQARQDFEDIDARFRKDRT